MEWDQKENPQIEQAARKSAEDKKESEIIEASVNVEQAQIETSKVQEDATIVNKEEAKHGQV